MIISLVMILSSIKTYGQFKYKIEYNLSLIYEQHNANDQASMLFYQISFLNNHNKIGVYYNEGESMANIGDVAVQASDFVIDLPDEATQFGYYAGYESGANVFWCDNYDQINPLEIDLNSDCYQQIPIGVFQSCVTPFGSAALYKIVSLFDLNPTVSSKICEEQELVVFNGCNGTKYSLEAIVDGDFNNPILLLPYQSNAGTYNFVPKDIANVTDSSIIQFQVYYTEDQSESDIITFDVVPCVPVLNPNVQNNLQGIDVTCNGGSDGGVIAVFDRALTDEELMKLVFKQNGIEVHQSNALDNSDFQGNSLTYESNSLEAGDYIVEWNVGTNNNFINGGSAPFTISEPSPIDYTLQKVDVSCEDGADGEILVQNLSGGDGNYTFEWTRNGNLFNPPQGSTDTHMVNLPEGEYGLIVLDGNNCEANEKMITLVALGESPKLISYTLAQPGDPPNHLATGSIYQLIVTGGIGSYTYNWAKNDVPFNPNNPTNIQSLEPGEYTLTIVDDNGMGCPSEEYTFIIEPLPPLEVTITEILGIMCEGDVGSLSAEPAGGTGGNYTYTWSTGENTQNIQVGEGSYTVTVEDNAGNTAMDSYSFDYQNPLLTVEVIQNNTLCKGEDFGSIQLNISGGTGGPYTIDWLDSPSNEAFRENLSPGNYVYFVSDGNCEVTNEDLPIVLTEPNIKLGVEPISVSSTSVNGAYDGTLDISAKNGVAPYNYEWTKDEIPFMPPVGSTNTQLINLGAGAYQVTVTDSNGCTALLEEPIIVMEPEPLTILSLDATPVACKGEASGSISANVTGVPPFSFIWEKQGEVTFLGPNQQTISGLAPGTYILKLSDATDFPEVMSIVTITEPDEVLTANLTPFPTECFLGEEGTVQVNPFGGTPPYIYSINGGSSFQGESTFFGLLAGDYEVLVRDSRGCEFTETTTVGLPNQIKAEFALASQVFVDETAMAIDLSYPIPEEVEWIIPESVLVLSENNDELEVRFTTPGEYEIGIKVIKENCWSIQTKSVLVLTKDTLVGEEARELETHDKIEAFIVYPNPSNGRFNVDIRLSKPGNIGLRIFGFANNNLIFQTQSGGAGTYDIPINIQGLSAGIYVVILETPYGNALRKLILR